MKSYYHLNNQEKKDYIEKIESYLNIRSNRVMSKNKAGMASFGRDPLPKELFNFERYSHSNWRWYFEKIKNVKFEKETPLWEQAMYPWKNKR